MTTRFTFLASLILLVCSCVEPVDLDFPESEPKLVVFAALTPDSLAHISLFKTQSFSATDNTNFVTSANVDIFSDEQLQSSLQSITASEEGEVTSIYKSPSFRPKTDQIYNLSITLDDFEEMTASCIIPPAMSITSVTLDNIITSDVVITESQIDKIFEHVTLIGSFTIEDPDDTRNYYHLANASISYDWPSIIGDDTTYILNAEVVDGLVVENEELDNIAYTSLSQANGFLIDDRFLNSSNAEIKFRVTFIRKQYQLLNHLVLNLRHCDKAYYDFHRTYAKQQENLDNPLAEPVVVTSNVKNGRGYFSGYSTGQGIFEFPPK